MGALPRVLLVHPDPGYRAELHRLLVVSGLRVVGEAGTAAGGLVLVRSRPADVLVISPCAGDMAGTIRYARREAGIGVVLLVTRVDEAFVVDMMVAGATGLVCDRNPDALPEAVRQVRAGDARFPAAQVRGLMEECCRRLDRQDCRSPWMRLSERQREVMELVRRGMDTHRIAETLVVEPVTVRAHISGALHRLGVSSREEAVAVLDGKPTTTGDRDRSREAG